MHSSGSIQEAPDWVLINKLICARKFMTRYRRCSWCCHETGTCATKYSFPYLRHTTAAATLDDSPGRSSGKWTRYTFDKRSPYSCAPYSFRDLEHKGVRFTGVFRIQRARPFWERTGERGSRSFSMSVLGAAAAVACDRRPIEAGVVGARRQNRLRQSGCECRPLMKPLSRVSADRMRGSRPPSLD